jgi:hypothetical protein
MIGSACFSYSADLPLDVRDRDAVQRMPRDSRLCFSYYPGGMPHDSKICFSYYPAGMPPGIGNRGAVPPAPHDSKLCFSY